MLSVSLFQRLHAKHPTPFHDAPASATRTGAGVRGVGTEWGPQPPAPCPYPQHPPQKGEDGPIGRLPETPVLWQSQATPLLSSLPEYLRIVPKAAPAAGRNIRGSGIQERLRLGSGAAGWAPLSPRCARCHLGPAAPGACCPQPRRFPSRRSWARGATGRSGRDSTLMPAMNSNSRRRQALTRPPASPTAI